MSDEYLRLGDMPPDFEAVLMREFVPYTVGLARVSDAVHTSFTPLGSGTLIKRQKRIGILTARHCLTACSPPVDVGSSGRDSLLLILRDARGVRLRSEEILEHELVTPSSPEYGPDLAFLEIAPSERLQTILAVASVWSLDRDSAEILKEFGSVGSMIVALGILEERSQTRIASRSFHRISYHFTCSHVIGDDTISSRDGWDYIDNRCVYSDPNSLPQSFGGFSGGGIWSVQVKKNKSSGKLSAGKAALVGVSFYETALENGVRYVRGHFIRSIYDLAWRHLA